MDYVSVKGIKTPIRRIQLCDDDDESATVQLTLWRKLTDTDIQLGDTLNVTNVVFNDRALPNIGLQVNTTGKTDIEVFVTFVIYLTFCIFIYYLLLYDYIKFTLVIVMDIDYYK